MTTIKLFAAAAVLTSMIATPVFAQGLREQSQNTSQFKKQQMKNANLRQNDRRTVLDRNSDIGFDRSYDSRGRGYGSDTGFFPLDAATGIVGGAVGAAGAIASAPFGGSTWDNGYASNNDWDDGNGRAGYRDSYASTNTYGRVGAFATAPYNNPYEYNRVTPDNGVLDGTYAQRNQFVCVPGTVFTNLNGIRTLCQ